MNLLDSIKLINSCLDLKREVVGVKFFFNSDDFKKFDVKQRPSKVTYCNAVQLASKGQAMKLTKANQACPNGAFALNFTPVPEPIINGKGRCAKGIYATPEIAKQINEDMLFMDRTLAGVAIMPLRDFKVEPDVVIVVSQSYNIMRLLQGSGYYNGYTNNLRTVGLQAVCQDLTTYPYISQDINISLLCPGTRLVADWQEDEIGLGLPFNKWYDMVNGVKQTTNAFERNLKKDAIIKRLNDNKLDSSWVIKDQNYDDNSYTGGKVEIE